MYHCDISRTLDSRIGPSGLSKEGIDRSRQAVAQAVARLKQKREQGNLPLAALAYDHEQLARMTAFSGTLSKDTSDLIVLGIGGSSLGGQALAQLAGWGLPGYAPLDGAPRIHFPENLDALTFERLLLSCDLRTTRFLVISKSGGTAEPLSQMLAAMTAIDEAGGGKYMKHHFGVLTGLGTSNPLRQVAEEQGFALYDHADIGGRYSVLSSTGLIPALLLGLNVTKLMQGAVSVLDQLFVDETSPVAECAAVTFGLWQEKTLSLAALTTYDDRLQRFGLWFRQLMGESLGKDGRGLTPLAGVGPVDQHSQLQLYLAGPNDKLHTIITRTVKGEGRRPSDKFAAGALSAYAGKTVGDLLDAEQRATIETLAENGRPVREIHLPNLDEESLGALLMHFMLETILLADLMGVDPYDQPAVEEGKIRARAYLAGEKTEA